MNTAFQKLASVGGSRVNVSELFLMEAVPPPKDDAKASRARRSPRRSLRPAE